jgi:hypothetical protein
MHGLNGYKEVIETIYWGLEQLGHQVSYAVNNASSDSTNIVFGAQVLQLEALNMLPEDSVIYNLEQLRGLSPDEVNPQLRFCAKRFKIWDYSLANLDTWKSLNRTDVHNVPIGFAPVLSKIPKVQNQDIDVLLYGLSGRNRLNVFNALSQSGLTAMFVSGLYGAARDNLIARSKLVLNINLYKWAKIFEVVRVSYLLANRKAVVSDLDPDTYVEEDIRCCVNFSPLEDMVAKCYTLLEDNSKRAAIEEAGFTAISKRDIRNILEAPLRK